MFWGFYSKIIKPWLADFPPPRHVTVSIAAPGVLARQSSEVAADGFIAPKREANGQIPSSVNTFKHVPTPKLNTEYTQISFRPIPHMISIGPGSHTL